MPTEDENLAERAALTERIERFKRHLRSFADPRTLAALRESIEELEARLKKLK
jgi:C4-dicarboxylate-specific signal transduction histidine kinase